MTICEMSGLATRYGHDLQTMQIVLGAKSATLDYSQA